ncbi:Pentatricopeptide repeat-containing protein [Drosera capensis]
MWTLRRASSISIRAHGFRSGAARSFGGLHSATSSMVEQLIDSQNPNLASCGWSASSRFCDAAKIPYKFSIGCYSLSSQAGSKSGEEEDDHLEDAFSELEEPEAPEKTLQNSLVDEEIDLVSESEVSDDGDDPEESIEEELRPDAGIDASEKKSSSKRIPSSLFIAIMKDQTQPIYKVLAGYVEDGKVLSREEISNAMYQFRKRKMYPRALQLSEWVEMNQDMELSERDYASRLDLIGKVRGLQKAETYIESIPKEFRSEVVYRTLLASYVSAFDVKKAEEVFNKMKDLGFPITAFACNQLLLLYKRTDKKKLADVLLLMEKEDIKPTAFTYNILIDTKGQSNDMNGMEQILETMKAEGMEPDLRTQAILARHYAAGGLKEKAEAMLKGIEGSDLHKNRGVCRILLPIHADLGNADEVGRVWEFCKKKPTQQECLAAIEAWGKLKKIEEAEAVFEHMVQTWKKPSSRHYAMLLKVYAKHKMLSKGKDLARKMGESGCHIGPLTWDALVKLYLEAGEVEKADAILHKAAQKNTGKPLFTSFLSIMDQYAKRGDVHNTEKMFLKMRQFGYVARARPFQTLLQAYINAKMPAYGFRERMKADNIFPNKIIAGQLAQVDAFRKTAVSDLLD